MFSSYSIEDFETVGKPFRAQYSGFCKVNDAHRYKYGDLVSRIQNSHNPFIPVTGVACKRCWISMEAAYEEED